jgi:hypothetical protein
VDEDGALFDSGFDGAKPFRDTPESGGISLESALRDFGPAALDDLIPRVRLLAVILDRAHGAGAVHGALHPNKVIITEDSTSLISGTSPSAPLDFARGKPYVAPEVIDGAAPGPASDQYALAAITYEWLFGRPIDRPAGRPVEVRSMPGADRAALSSAFTRALSRIPEDRFDSCSAFCDRLAGAVVPELPLTLGSEPEIVDTAVDQDWPRPASSLDPEDDAYVLAPFEPERDHAFVARGADPDLDAIDREVPFSEAAAEPALASWDSGAALGGGAAAQGSGSARFGGGALILAAVVGAIFGFAAGYMALPRALQSAPPQTMAVRPPIEAGRAGEAGGAGEAGRAGKAGSDDAQSRPAPPAIPAQVATGRVLVRSNPAGATVTVDGVESGVTPLALRDLAFGTRSITVARRGYTAETRRVAISRARPSRTIDVRLNAEPSASAAAGRTGAPATAKPAAAAKPAVATGALVIESRPAGAAVSINGTRRGSTPLTVSDLAPGEYRILMTLPGFRNFATTVRVVAGERVRAAASLTAQEQE